jgi:hypothetical protein
MLGPRSRPRRSAGKNAGSRRTSDYRGVSFHKPSAKWRVRIKVGSSEVRLGYFATELQAAQRYDEAARVYHGQDAWLNFGANGVCAPLVPGGATHKAAACEPAAATRRAAQPRKRAPKAQPRGSVSPGASPERAATEEAAAATTAVAAYSSDYDSVNRASPPKAVDGDDGAERARESLLAAQLLFCLAADSKV